MLNENFRNVTFDERVKESCFQLGYEDPVVVQSMYIFKNPGIGGIGMCHTFIKEFLNKYPSDDLYL